MHDYNSPRYIWDERYELGVPSIDEAHEEMFKVINRVHKMIRIGGNVKWTVAEAIKFFMAYAVRHFEDEEAFMRSVAYTRYDEHKYVHDGMRYKILPRVYSRLTTTDYSQDSIALLLRVSEKWLNKHILGHDRNLVTWMELSRPAETS